MLSPEKSPAGRQTPPGTSLRSVDETPCDRLDEIIGDYLAALELGQAPPREQLLAAHPDLARELGEFLDDQDRVDAVMAPLVRFLPR